MTTRGWTPDDSVENSQPRHHRRGLTGDRLYALHSPGSTVVTGEYIWRHAPDAT